MEARAISKHISMSPRKMRRVLNLVRGVDVEKALNTLHFTSKAAAEPIAKTIASAFANLGSKEEGERIEMSEVFIKTAFVDGGPSLKRFRPMSMGRAGRIRKRSSHLTIIVEERINDSE